MAATDSSGFVNNWQEGKTVTECNLRMLQEEDWCDVTFRCGTEGNVVKAHRYMLISRSCVFHAMLTGTMAEKSDVKIPDIEPLVFKTFLKYIYTDDTDINADNVTDLLYTARKYGVTSLETKSSEFLDRNLSPDNACVILEAAHRFDQKQLYEKALTVVKSQGERSLQSLGFRALSQVLVDEIVGSDDLVADEHEIFTAVNDWSEAECIRQEREVTPESKRSVLGGTLMKVRFPLMKATFIAEEVKKSELLTADERLLCFDLVSSTGESSGTFNRNQRTKKLLPIYTSKCRFTQEYFMKYAFQGSIDAICFSANVDILLNGYQLRGECESTYSVTSYLGDEDNVMCCVVQERTEYTSEGEVFDVIFSRPFSVSAGEWYTLAVRIKGPKTSVGTDGQEKVVCDDGVELQFRDSRHSNNWTSTCEGQIPSLIYRKC